MRNGLVNARNFDPLSATRFGAGLSSDVRFAANKLTSTASSLNQQPLASAAAFHDIFFDISVVSERGAHQLAEKDAAPAATATTGAKTNFWGSLCKSE